MGGMEVEMELEDSAVSEGVCVAHGAWQATKKRREMEKEVGS